MTRLVRDIQAEERERCAKIAEDWLAIYSKRDPQFVSAKTWAGDAIKDIIDAIRRGPDETPR